MHEFRRSVFWCLIVTYLVIFAGAIVRGTGSGLGCPDWPKCFGQWVPPVHISELPANYKEEFKIAGREIADFEPFKTWTEYINRLVGAFLGLLLIRLFFKALEYKRTESNLPWFCGGLLFLVIIQGGVGAMVVSTHLQPYIITFHMLLAMLLLFGLHYLYRYCHEMDFAGLSFKPSKRCLMLGKLTLLFTFIQVLMGTQVRQQVDHLIRDEKSATAQTVISQLDSVFYVHRSFSVLLLICLLFYLVSLYRKDLQRSNFVRGIFILFLIGINIISGMGLNYFGFPAQLQPPHLFFAMVAIGLQYNLYLRVKGSLL